LAFKNNSNSSKFVLLLENGYPFGKMENVMQILPHNKKVFYMDIIEKFHIYKEIISDSQLNEKHTVTPNKIFETVIKSESHNISV
jgi:hypothetical protein